MGGCSERHCHDFDSALFDKLHGSDEMAVEKLAQGIQGFAADQDKLELQLAKLANMV
jgi:transaldolase